LLVDFTFRSALVRSIPSTLVRVAGIEEGTRSILDIDRISQTAILIINGIP